MPMKKFSKLAVAMIMKVVKIRCVKIFSDEILTAEILLIYGIWLKCYWVKW